MVGSTFVAYFTNYDILLIFVKAISVLYFSRHASSSETSLSIASLAVLTSLDCSSDKSGPN